MTATPLPIADIRRQFPALALEHAGEPLVFLDGPAGSQTPQRVADAVSRYMLTMNANHGGRFPTSIASDAALDEAHATLADFLGAPDPKAVIFGANMTSLTFALSRALARTWQPADEVIVTHLDHDANVTPWTMAARDAGAIVRRVEILPDCTLDLHDLAGKLNARTRLVAIGCASNAVGTINPVAEICRLAHRAGAQVFLDAVHYAPHGLIDVQAWGCDYLACSAYKFFGPHVGVLWGKTDLLQSLPAYKVRPAPNDLPGKWMTGTQNHEGICGAAEAVNYLADVGRSVQPHVIERRAALKAAFAAIEEYERDLAGYLLEGLQTIAKVRIWGIDDPERTAERVPTVSITHAKHTAIEVADLLGRRGICVWHGNFYALPLTERLGLEPEGMVRIGLLHYNTRREIDRLLNALQDIS